MFCTLPFRHHGAALTSIAAILCTLAAGCASVTVKKVPSPTQYETWSDDDQRMADQMEGVRFYLPRPFVNVFESFPIATDVYIASGVASADGKYVYISSITPMSTRSDITLADGGVSTKVVANVPTAFLLHPRDPARAGRPTPNTNDPLAETRSDAPDGKTPGVPDILKPIADATGAGSPAKKAAERAEVAAKRAEAAAIRAERASGMASTGSNDASASKTGQSTRKVTNNNGAFAYLPMRGNMDLVYLPDFDEQYVVTSKSNLGNAEFQMNLGQGWSLQGFDSFTDNSELTKRVFDVIDTAITAAKTGLSMVFPPAGAADALGALRSDTFLTPDEINRAIVQPGTPVTLKIVVVHYAAKGLYPVIKPRELKSLAPSSLLIDLFAKGGTTPSFLDEPTINAAMDNFDTMQRRFTVPIYPYQYISFNTFRFMAIEVLTPSGLPFGNLYDKTGTTGDAGDRQAADLAELINRLIGNAANPPPPAPTTTDPCSKAAVSAALKALGNENFRNALTEGLQADAALALSTTTVARLGLELTAAPAGKKFSNVTANIKLTPAVPEDKQEVTKDFIAAAIAAKIKSNAKVANCFEDNLEVQFVLIP